MSTTPTQAPDPLPLPHSAPQRTEVTAILHAIEHYMAALYSGDADALAQAFHPRATYATVSGDAPLILSLPEYLEVVRHRQSPQARGDSPAYEIQAIQFAGHQTALITLRSTMLGRQFEDFLSLLHINGRWQIIAKVFHYTPQSTPGA